MNAVRCSFEIGQCRLFLWNTLWRLLGSVTGSERDRAAGIVVVSSMLLAVPRLTPLLWSRLLMARLRRLLQHLLYGDLRAPHRC